MKNNKEIVLDKTYNILGWVLVVMGISEINLREILWTKILAGALGLRYFDYLAVIGLTVLVIGIILIVRNKVYRGVMIFFFVILGIVFFFQVIFNVKLYSIVTNLELAGIISGQGPSKTISFMCYLIIPVITVNSGLFFIFAYNAFTKFLESEKKAKYGNKKGKTHIILMIPFKKKDDRQLKE